MPSEAPLSICSGRYVLQRRIEATEITCRWLGYDSLEERPCVIERLRDPELVDTLDPEWLSDRARAVSHPNLRSPVDAVLDERAQPAVIYQPIEGLSLREWTQARGGRTPWTLVCAILIEVCRAVGALHEHAEGPFVHGALDASRVVLSTGGTVKVDGVGLVRALSRASKPHLASLAPELISGGRRTPASDVYALGVLLWESIAQRELFQAPNDLSLVLMARRVEPLPLHLVRDDVPETLGVVADRALAKTAEARSPSALDLARALAEVLRSEQARATKGERLGKSVRSALDQAGRGLT